MRPRNTQADRGHGAQRAEEVARGVFAAIDAHDLAAVASFMHPDDVQDFVPIGVRHGRPAVVALFAELIRALPDLSIKIEKLMADEMNACVRWHATGTFTGAPFQGLLPTGRSVNLRGTDAFIELEDGLIKRNTIYYDGATFARDIGLLPARGSCLERVMIAAFNLRTRVVGTVVGTVSRRYHSRSSD